MTNYYPIEFKIKGISKFCIWHTNDVDLFILESKKVKCFKNLQDLVRYCEYNGFVIDTEVTLYDIDFICSWLDDNNIIINYPLFLNVWNITSDIASSTNEDFYGDHDGIVLDIYNKLFYGNNPSSLKGSEEDFIPSWDEEDREELVKVLRICTDFIDGL